MKHLTRSWSVRILGTTAVVIAAILSAPQAAFGAAPTIVGPATAPAGGTMIVSGAGWVPYDSVRIYLGLAGVETYSCSVTASATGVIPPTGCGVPTNLQSASYKVQAVDASSTVNATATTKLVPSLSLSNPTTSALVVTAGAGNAVQMTGYGFVGNIASVEIGTTAVTPSSLTVTSGGQYSAKFTVPSATKAGAYTVTVTDRSKNAATTRLAVYHPTFVAPASAAAGSNFEISGAGWPPNDAIHLNLVAGASNAYVCGFESNSTGAIPAQGCITPSELGARSYNVVATDGGDAVTATLPAYSFKMLPTLYGYSSVSSSSQVTTAAAGNTVDLEGYGFGASGRVGSITFDTTALKFAATNMSSDGTFQSEIAVVIPATATVGLHTITVTDNATAKDAGTLPIEVYHPTLTTAGTGSVDQNFTASGAGWPGGDRLSLHLITGPVTDPITSSTASCSGSLTTAGNGTLAAESCVVPAGLHAGAYTLETVDQYYAVVVLGTFTIKSSIALVSAYDAQPVIAVSAGQLLGVTGLGFGGNIASAKIGTTAVSLSTETVSNGTFPPSGDATFTVPSTLAAGTYVVTLTDTGSNSATADIEVVKPTLSLGAKSLSAGEPLIPTGAGWPANDRVALSLVVGSIFSPTASYPICSVYTNSEGSIIPAIGCQESEAPAGSYTLLALDASDAVVVTGTLAITPSISLTNTSSGEPAVSVAPGAVLSVTGYGFGGTVSVTSLKVGTTSATFSASTSSNGTFSGAEFTVPSLAAGTYTVTVTDADHNSATASITIT